MNHALNGKLGSMETMSAIAVASHEKSVCDALKKGLENLGYRCRTFGTVSSALNGLVKEPAHIILFDVLMPDMNTLEFMKRVAESSPDAVGIPMIGDGSFESVLEAMRGGVRDFIAKPVDMGQLALVVRIALERKRFDEAHPSGLKGGAQGGNGDGRLSEPMDREMDEALIDTIRTFTSLLEKRDEFMGSHSKRVAASCLAVCRKLDLRDNVRGDIETAALLHDIGKIVIPDSILRKMTNFISQARLTDEEKRAVRMHPVIGQEAVEMIAVLHSVSPIIRHHHELFNGSGYPDQLTGYNIPLGSRIISVVDTYDKLVYSVDHKRRSAARKFVIDHLQKNAGVMYDPDIVKFFVEFIEEQDTGAESRKEKTVPVGELAVGMVLARDLSTTGGVLLVYQGDAIKESDIARIRRFRQRKAVVDTAYVLESPVPPRGVSAESGDSPRSGESGGEETAGYTVNREDIIKFKRVKDIIDNAKGLSTLPAVYQNAITLLNDPSSTRRDIASVLRQDQAIVAKMLRVVNSPLFAFSRRISTIEDAIPLLGFSEIRNIVTSVSVITTFASGKGSDVFDRSGFWKHSAGSAIVCKVLARKLKIHSEEECFTAALLHDIGKLVLDQLFPQDFSNVISLVNEKSVPMREAEQSFFGRPHQTVGDYFIRKWKIPDVLADAVCCHHSPRESKVNPFLVSAVHLADVIIRMLNIGDSGEKQSPVLDEFAKKQLGISEGDVKSLLPVIEEHLRQSDDLLRLGE
jgi:putative nucleotidyltransferase with HDIG domain